MSDKVNETPSHPAWVKYQRCMRHTEFKYYLSTRRSALSDIKCEAQVEHFISDKARLQVL